MLTNLDLRNKKDYDDFLNLLNYNWISKYIIIFNGSDQEYNTDEASAKLNYMVPNLLASKLVQKRELKKIEDIKDKPEFYYWCLKYMFNVKKKDNWRMDNNWKYKDKFKNKDGSKKLIFDILKYINIIKNPELNHIYSIKN